MNAGAIRTATYHPLWLGLEAINDTIAGGLQKSKQPQQSEDLKALVHHMYDFLLETAPRVPDDPTSLNDLLNCEMQVARLLRRTDQEREAEELSRAAAQTKTRLKRSDGDKDAAQ